MNISASVNAEYLLERNSISCSDLERWTQEFLQRLVVDASELSEVRIVLGTYNAMSTYGRFLAESRTVVINLPVDFSVKDIRATLIHELVHLAQLVRGSQFQIPEVGDTVRDSWEFAVLYYATSKTEMEALSWEVTVFPERYELLREAVKTRMRLKD